jgi:SAM-dependent methyltransferase
VESDIARRLVTLNREFYQTLAEPFSATRAGVQPGVKRLLERIPPGSAVIDLGCGNANAARFLAESGFGGSYAGFDLSSGLLDIARAETFPFSTSFQQTDFLAEGWSQAIPGQAYDFALAFAVLHHIPGRRGRSDFLAACRRLLAPGGVFFLSTWQFQRSARLRERIVPWFEIGLDDSDVDPEDYLLDWRHEGSGLRYVHIINAQERFFLAEKTGFIEKEFFVSDGKGGNLADYAVWAEQAS